MTFQLKVKDGQQNIQNWFDIVEGKTLVLDAMQCNAMQCNAMQCNAMQCNMSYLTPFQA